MKPIFTNLSFCILKQNYSSLQAIKQRLEIAKSVSKIEARKLFTETKDDQVLCMAYYWVSQGAYDNCKDLPLNKCPITHLNHDTANRMWRAVRNHLGYKGENNTHGLIRITPYSGF